MTIFSNNFTLILLFRHDMKYALIFFLVLGSLAASAQSTHDFIVSAGQDLIKTDIDKPFDKAQFGIEGNYFVVRHFAVGAGVELWTANPNSFVMGMRWYADDHFFGRLRGLIGANDVSVGAGWSKPFMTNWRFEALADFYFHGDFGLRAGVAYIIR